jgi:4-coumarate--CoA ligase
VSRNLSNIRVDLQNRIDITDGIGFQVPPASLEGLLAAHPKVADVAVIGIYSKSIASEVPRAYILPRAAPSSALAKELIKFVHDHVAQHKRLRGGVVFVDAIPKSGSGKILRRVLREQAKKDTADPLAYETKPKL